MSWDDEWATEDDDAEALRRAQADQKKRAAAVERRQTTIAWALLSAVLAGLVFATNDSFGEPRPVGVNLLLALVLCPIAALLVAGVIGEVLLGPMALRKTPMRSTEEFENRYGARHRSERAKWAERIRTQGGALCAERVCLMRTRSIGISDQWHLAHDHEHGGAREYLGPAHPECNQAEALRRGQTWPGAPTLQELLAQVAARSSPPRGRAEGHGEASRDEQQYPDPWSAADPWGPTGDDPPF